MSSEDSAKIEAFLIANPIAGRGQSLSRLAELEKALRARGVVTHRVLDRIERKKIAAGHFESGPTAKRVFVVIGGDGTVNALVNESPTAPICHFASGTENLFSRAFGMPRNPDSMADWILGSQASRMDIGEFRVDTETGSVRKRFALMLGFGFDAAVVNRHHSRRVVRKSGTTSRLAYFAPLAHEALHYPFPPVRTVWKDETGTERSRTGTTTIVFNFDCYALGLKFAPGATPTDGHLDMVCFESRGSIRAGLYLAMVASGIHVHLKSVGLDRMREIRIEAIESPVPAQMDGDPAGWLEPGRPWIVRCLPSACPVLVTGTN